MMHEYGLTKYIAEKLHSTSARNAWQKGVLLYAEDLVDRLEENLVGGWIEEGALVAPYLLEKQLLEGAIDWFQYSYGGCSLIYNWDIAKRLCTKSQFVKTGEGRKNPNSKETWLDVQARALYQACLVVKKHAKDYFAKEKQQ